MKNGILTYLDRIKSDQSGAAAVVFALSMPIVLGAMVLVVEAGHWQQNRTKLQYVADMAAIAGARELVMTNSDDDAKTAAIGDAAEGGFNFTSGTVSPTTTISDGPYAGMEGVKVTVTQEQPLYFSKYFFDGKNSFTYQAEAVALLSGPGDPVCILSLGDDPNVNYHGIEINGSSEVTVEGCDLFSNNPSSESIEVSGAGELGAECAKTVGDFEAKKTDNVELECGNPQINQGSIPDPFSDVEMPPEASEGCKTPKTNTKDLLELEPGRYCGDYKVKDIVFTQPGNYVFDGGGFDFKSSSGSMTGSGVTIFLANDADMDINGADIDLTAPTSGDYQGILFYGDRDTMTQGNSITVEANGTAKMEGVIYFPTMDLRFSGGSNLESDCLSVAAYNVKFIGNSEMTSTGCDPYRVATAGNGDIVAIFQ